MLNIANQTPADRALIALGNNAASEPLLDKLAVLTALNSLSAIAKHEQRQNCHVMYVPKSRWETKVLAAASAESGTKSYVVIQKTADAKLELLLAKVAHEIVIIETE